MRNDMIGSPALLTCLVLAVALVGVSTAWALPDLAVTSASVPWDGGWLRTGRFYETADFCIKNRGTTTADDDMVRVDIWASPNPDELDTFGQNVLFAGNWHGGMGLAPGEEHCNDCAFEIGADKPYIKYYIWVYVNEERRDEESNPNNNTFRITNGWIDPLQTGYPDLLVDRIAFDGEGRTRIVRDGGEITLKTNIMYSYRIYVKNQGDESAPETGVILNWNDAEGDCDVLPIQNLMLSGRIAGMSAGSEKYENGTKTWIASQTGRHSLVARADKQDEADEGTGEDNNDFCATLIIDKQVQDPFPDIEVNGQDGDVYLSRGQAAVVTVSLDPGNTIDYPVDWWVVVDAGGQWFSYVSGGWRSGIHRACLYPPGEVNDVEVLDYSLWSGDYTFYFALDDDGDGHASGDFLDYVRVTVY